MQITVGTEGGLAVIHVQGLEILEPHDPVELVHGRGKSFRGAQVVAGGEGVAGIDADADAGLVVNLVDDGAQVLEAAADNVTVAAHVLEDGDDSVGGAVGAVQLRGDAGRGGGHGVAAGGTRVEVVQLDAEGIAPLQVVDKVVIGLVRLGLVGLCQVDEVGAVREDVQALVVEVFLGEGVEGIAGRGVEGRRGPFPLGLEEEGEGVSADVDGIGDGILDTWTNEV